MDVNVLTNTGPAFALLGAGLVAGLAGVGSAIGSGIAGSTAAGVTTEKPELFGKVLVFQMLIALQAILGFFGAFVVLFYVKVSGLSFAQGLEVFAACVPLALICLYSAIYQGKVSAASIQLLAKNAHATGKAFTLVLIVETFAVLGFLITFFILHAIKVAVIATT